MTVRRLSTEPDLDHGHVEVAVRTVRAPRPGTEDHQDGDSLEVLRSSGDVLDEWLHGLIVTSLGRSLAAQPLDIAGRRPSAEELTAYQEAQPMVSGKAGAGLSPPHLGSQSLPVP